jgi:PKD repeat protein
MLWVALYAIYLALILISINVFIAENSVDEVRKEMDPSYTYHLTFDTDGKTTHYDVTRHDIDTTAKITLTYWTQDNKLDITKVENIKTLKIDVQSMFEDESMKVFKQSHSDDQDLNLAYWLEAGDGVFTIDFDIDQSEPMEELTFTEFPEPVSVLVNNVEWWKSNTNYQKAGKEIIISDIPTGKTTVILYFKEANKLPVAAFTTNPTNKAGVNEDITYNGSSSVDSDGKIISWVWKFGDGDTDSGETVVHKYSTPGTYTIRLTVKDDAIPFGENWIEKNIIVEYGLEVDDDGDGLRDYWEWENFQDLGYGPEDDPDSDGYVNGLEFLAGTDPSDGEDFAEDSDTDDLPDTWEWTYFKDLDENKNGDPDSDGATNKVELDATTDPTNPKSKPKETGSGEKDTGDTDLSGIFIAVILVIVVLIILMFVFKSKKSKGKAEEVEEEPDEEAIAEMEAKIQRAKKLGLPTGQLEKLLHEAKTGKPMEVEPVKESRKSGKSHKGSKPPTDRGRERSRRGGSHSSNRGRSRSSGRHRR